MTPCRAADCDHPSRPAPAMYCSDRCRWREHERRRRQRPEWREEKRRYNRRTHRRPRTKPLPWAYGAPAHGDYLPGGALTLRFDPDAGLKLEHTYLLHGLLTKLLGVEHDPLQPRWSLLPWHTGCGWAVYLPDPEDLWLAGRSFKGRLGHTIGEAVFGPAARIKAPDLDRRGRLRVRVVAVTPVVTRKEGSSVLYTAPGASTICSTLWRKLAPLLGVDVRESEVRAKIIRRHTEARTVQMGGKYPAQRGWVGEVELEVNAPAAWLLLAAARGPGLGGRTAFGFGRIHAAML